VVGLFADTAVLGLLVAAAADGLTATPPPRRAAATRRHDAPARMKAAGHVARSGRGGAKGRPVSG
jgi:hypothetical protein